MAVKKSQKKQARKPKELTKEVALVPEVLPGLKLGAPTKYEPRFAHELIEWMGQGFSFESFAFQCRCTKKTLYNWAEKHADFLHAKEIGKAGVLAFYENAIRNAALGLVPPPPANAPLGTSVTRPSATAILFMLKVHGREEGYNDGIPFFTPKAPQLEFEYEDL